LLVEGEPCLGALREGSVASGAKGAALWGVVGAMMALLAGAADISGVSAAMAIVTSRARGVLSKTLGRPAVLMVGEEVTVGLTDDLPAASASRLARSSFSCCSMAFFCALMATRCSRTVAED